MGSNYIEMRLEDCMDAIIDYRGKTALLNKSNFC